MISIKGITHNTVVALAAQTAIAYAITYMGRAYVAINPKQAALFTLATGITIEVGNYLFQKINSKYPKLVAYSEEKKSVPTLIGRIINAASRYSTTAFVLSSGIFSPTQAITAFALRIVASNSYYVLTGKNI